MNNIQPIWGDDFKQNLFNSKIPISTIKAILDPLEVLENILSAKNAFPIATPYSPPFILLSTVLFCLHYSYGTCATYIIVKNFTCRSTFWIITWCDLNLFC